MVHLWIMVMLIGIKSLVSTQINYSVKENAIIGTVVGNIYSSLSPPQNKSKLELIKNDYGVDSYFSLDKDTGELIVRSVIDRESICEEKKEDDCLVTLLVDRDIDVIQIRMKIEDVNDNSPVFLSAHKIINIQENIPIGTTYFLPVAQDRDTSKYGVNNYSISGFRAIDSKNSEKYISKDRFFRIEGNASPQLRVIGLIDREEITSFIFLFVASDVGQRTGSCTMTIIITDVNDNSPEWRKDNYKVKIKECQVHGEILEFDATDKDDPNTSNGRVTYRLSDRTKNRDKISQIFYISGNKLYLSNNRPSELSNTGILLIYVIAMDGNGRMKETSVEVTVEDCNDHPPIISISKRYGQILENVKEKQSLSIINVKDNDRGMNGVFECSLNDTSVLNLVKRHIDMSQNNIIYKIETNGEHSFDREISALYTIEIKCADQGDPSMTSTQIFSINILDQNDNAPKFFDKMQVFHISENNAVGSTIGLVKAFDPDSGANGHVKYSVQGENDYFAISIYGEIQSKIRFDREEKDHYEFNLIVTDNGSPSLNDTMTVKVIIGDVNDCKPVFSDDYVFNVTESVREMTKNEKLGEIRATDQDIGNNGTVHYKIVSLKTVTSTGNILTLKPQLQRFIRISFDGVISIYGNLDRETISSIQLTVEAFDNGYPKLSSETTVMIEILDLNDNAPTFTFPNKINQFLNISLESDIGAHVGTVSAQDPDQGANGRIIYSIVGADKQPYYPLKLESDGKIIVNSELKKLSVSRRLPNVYSIRASDGGSPPKSTTETLFINYVDSSHDQSYQISARKSTEHPSNNSLWKPNKRVNENYLSNTVISDSMMLLYCLAAILFFVFIIVFSVLLYIYCSRAYINSERNSKKPYKTDNSSISSKHNMKELQQIARNPDDFPVCRSGNDEDGATVCFLNEDGSSYTHLMMLNNNKYTPMLHSPSSRNSFIRNQSEILSVSQNYLDAIINNSKFESPSPQISKSSMKKYSFPNTRNSPLANCPENYSTLQDKSTFNSLNRKQSIRTSSSPIEQYARENSDFCHQQKNFNSPYVTSSFV